mmetsp:Transcript_4025/g.5895  ORF Transcript_4025/g.5895 Transcript_4025/m.5895 type:complete len:183 (-) Transcript_4025:90-638(-)
MLIATILILEYYFLSVASTKLPSHLHSSSGTNNQWHRWGCLKSDKGGKRQWGDVSESSTNPCFFQNNSVRWTIQQDGTDNGTFLNDIQVQQYLNPTRDCGNAQGGRCTQNEPCTPCQLSKRIEFGDRWARCQSCSTKYMGDCNFVHGVGPYCYKSATSRDVIPCKKCCTEPIPMFEKNGTCY